ncbi:LDLR chaperone MESD [Cocos nucifera]|uniref:LDLR chaperone MESD n=1 Tax=Cocos nucifera TaxID=13894 RepID=A0A8K0IFE5_COCNU|nr:LDLR chaperone MESD [Cocos nucifera]
MEKEASPTITSRALLLVLGLLLLLFLSVEFAEGKKKVSIPDDLDDVVDDEEDEDWKQWGKKKSSSVPPPPPPDFSRMNPAEIQAEMMKLHTGPSYGFVKLRPGTGRTREDVPQIAMRWSKVLRTGSIEAKFMAVDLSTIMFTMVRGQDLEELEAYEMKIGDQVYRRPGDPPLDEVFEMLQRKKSDADGHDPTEDLQISRDEL